MHTLNFKDNKKFHSKKSLKLFYICQKNYLSAAFRQLLENPDAYFNEKLLKEDDTFTTSVALTHIDGKGLVIKRYNIKNLWHGLKRAIQPSRAARCWYYSHLLQHHRINTPAPIAMIEKRFGPFRRQAYFISEYIEGADGSAIFCEKDVAAVTQQKCAVSIIELIQQMHNNLISHGDLKSTNFIFKDTKPFIIDLDAMRQHSSISKAKHRLSKDRRVFLLNWHNHPCKSYFNHF